MKKFPFLFVLVCLSFIYTLAQSDKPLTNQDVIELSKSGLPATVIISKIKTSKVDFKTDVADLKLLVEEKVPESVISTMVEKQAEANAPRKPIEYAGTDAEHGAPSELRGKTKVYLVVDDAPSRQIIANALAKNSNLQIVSSRDEADFGLRFAIGRVDVGSNALLNTAHNVVVVGELSAYIYLPVKEGADKGRIRYLWQKRKQQDWSGGLTFSRHPAQNAINEFLKDLKKINQ